jgi:hypothetical protein
MNDLRNAWSGSGAVVLGNGPSRLLVDPQKIMDSGAILIGCNAIVRDGSPDYVVGTDSGVLEEWEEIGDPTPVYVVNSPTPPIEVIGGRRVLKWCPYGQGGWTGMTSGIYAMLLAVWLGCDPVYLAGFDQDAKNVYEGTRNYWRRSIGWVDSQPMRMLSCLNSLYAQGVTRAHIFQFPPHTIEWATELEVPEEWLSHD